MDTFNEFTLEIAQNLIESNDLFPVNFNNAWVWLEYSTKSDAKASFKKCGFVESIDYISFQDFTLKPLGGRPTEIIQLSIECFKCWAMMSKTEAGKIVRKYFLDCEKIAKEKQSKPLSVSESLLLSVQQLVEVERYLKENVELYINTTTGESFASKRGYARMVNKDESTIRKRLRGADSTKVLKAEVLTDSGIQSADLITESLICKWLPKDNPEMASKLMQLGVRGFLHTLAGYEVKSTLTKPMSAAEMFLQQAQILIQFEQKQAKLELEQQKQSEVLIQQAVQIEVARVLAEQNQATIAIQQQKIDSLEASLDALRAVINQPLPTCQQTKRQRIVETMQLIGRVIFERKLKPSIHEAMREAWVQLTSKIKHSSARKDLPLQKANMERAYTKAMEDWKLHGGVKPRKKDYFLTYGELIEKNKIEDEALSCANTLALQLL